MTTTEQRDTTSTDDEMTTLELTFPSDGLQLAGTLVVPGGPPGPAAVLVSGSGPVDRNSDAKRQPLGVMRQVADHLAAAGIASLRYDKRGVGASQGDFHGAGLHDNVADARAAVLALRERPEVDADRIVVVGHSEGAVIAAELAADPELGLAGVALLAGAARPGEDVLRWQGEQVAATLPAPAKAVLRLLRKDVRSMQDKRIAELRATTEDVVRMQLVRVNAKWFREFLDHDPATALAKVVVPVLALTGAKDIQVDPADVERMRALVPTTFTGVVVEDVTHLLRADDGPPGPKTYRKQIRRPVDRRVLERVADWTTGVTALTGR